MDTEERCQLCKGIMKNVSTRIISGSEYIILKCTKCHHQIARRIE